MKNKSFLVLIAFFIASTCFTGFLYAAEKVVPPSEELEVEQLKIANKMVRITEREGAFPQTVISEPGTTVVWINNSRSTLEVQFLDKKVTLACGSPVNFFINTEGAYESGKIPYGGTASLCFLEKGTYDYMVRVNRTFYKPAFGGMAKDHRGRIDIR